jgi:hypothetical protein
MTTIVFETRRDEINGFYEIASTEGLSIKSGVYPQEYIVSVEALNILDLHGIKYKVIE